MSGDPSLEGLREALEPDPRHEAPTGDRLAAVLAPILIEHENAVVFTRRPEGMSRHPGQISFPGGMLHEEDATAADAALRETHEEIGLAPADVELLGSLPPVHTVVSGTLVVPFVGLVRGRPLFVPSAAEVAEVFEVPIARLLDVEVEEGWERGDQRFTTYVYEVDGRTIWGATAHMLHDLLEIVRG
ncbi:MAG: CoA pyrophosphatase [Actinomycetota bacterium]